MRNTNPPDVRSSSVSSHAEVSGPAVRRRLPTSSSGESGPVFLTIAVVIGPWGVRGDVKVRLETDFPERFARLKRVYLGPKHQPFEFGGFRQHGARGLLKLKGCNDREAAEELSGLEVQIPIAEAMPLPEGSFYEHQLRGLDVLTEDGELLGVLEEVLFTGGNAVYVVRGPRGEVLLPVLKDVVLHVNLDAGQMTVRLPPGLLD